MNKESGKISTHKIEHDIIHKNKYSQKFLIIKYYFPWTAEFDFWKESKCRLEDVLSSSTTVSNLSGEKVVHLLLCTAVQSNLAFKL